MAAFYTHESHKGREIKTHAKQGVNTSISVNISISIRIRFHISSVRVSRSSQRLVGGIGFICLNLLCESSAIGFICLKQLAGWCHQLHLPLPSRSKWWYRLHLPQPPLQVRRYWLHLPPATGRVVSSASSASTVETFRMHAKRTVNQDRTCSRLGQRSPGPASVSASASASTSTSASTTSGQNGTEWRILQNGTTKGELLERGAD